MAWNPFCTNPTKAARRYTQRVASIMIFYVATVMAVTRMVRAHHFAGPKLWFLSCMPAVPIVALLVVVGLYLREEVDEFKRQQLVIAMLVAIGVTLAVSAVGDFLRSYGAISSMPPFLEFVTFWGVMGVVGAVQHLQNRVGADA